MRLQGFTNHRGCEDHWVSEKRGKGEQEGERKAREKTKSVLSFELCRATNVILRGALAICCKRYLGSFRFLLGLKSAVVNCALGLERPPLEHRRTVSVLAPARMLARVAK
jgi:hypothetical protein